MIPFAAVLLAGGQSRRMGRDKALLPLPDGRLLWQRQLDVLRELRPAELFISGPPRPGFPSEIPCLLDVIPGRGPLGGIQAAMVAMNSLRLLVLAIDLPQMTTGFLRALLLSSRDEAQFGVVPRWPENGFYEPLAAAYPTACRDVVEKQLTAGDGSMQRLIQEAGTLLKSHIISPDEAPLFVNWNQPNLDG